MTHFKVIQQYKHYWIMGLGLTAYGLLVFFTGNTSICIVKVHTGFPCPGCGMTRAMLAFFHMDFRNAFRWHPLWPLVFILPVVLAIFNYSKALKERYLSKMLLVTLLLIMSVYIMRMILLFPKTAPMDFNYNAIPIKYLRFLLRF